MKSHLKTKVYTLAAEMQHIHRNEVKWKARAKQARIRQHQEHLKEQATNKTVRSIDYAESNFWSLRVHRQGLKPEARFTHLAYGFMRGRTYQQMENICYGGLKGFGSTEPNWARIEEIVLKFSKDEPALEGVNTTVEQRFAEWLIAAKVWYDGNPVRIELANAVRENARTQRANDPEYQKQRTEAAKLAREQNAA